MNERMHEEIVQELGKIGVSRLILVQGVGTALANQLKLQTPQLHVFNTCDARCTTAVSDGFDILVDGISSIEDATPYLDFADGRNVVLLKIVATKGDGSMYHGLETMDNVTTICVNCETKQVYTVPGHVTMTSPQYFKFNPSDA